VARRSYRTSSEGQLDFFGLFSEIPGRAAARADAEAAYADVERRLDRWFSGDRDVAESHEALRRDQNAAYLRLDDLDFEDAEAEGRAVRVGKTTIAFHPPGARSTRHDHKNASRLRRRAVWTVRTSDSKVDRALSHLVDFSMGPTRYCDANPAWLVRAVAEASRPVAELLGSERFVAICAERFRARETENRELARLWLVYEEYVRTGRAAGEPMTREQLAAARSRLTAIERVARERGFEPSLSARGMLEAPA